MDRKILDDWLIATQETLSTLHYWVQMLDEWRNSARIEPDDFSAAVQQLRDAGLWTWANEAGGHGIKALVAVINEQNGELNERNFDPTDYFAADHLSDQDSRRGWPPERGR